MKNQKPLLTISLLISNRPDTIPRCLDSLLPLMEALPSELILIDTSKSKEIHEMLLGYTNLVYEFEWCNDFAKARNEGIRRARGEWFLYLDDDEWFEGIDQIVDFFKIQEYKQYCSANMPIRNYTNLKYTQYTDGWVTRLFCLEGVRFEGKVHEYLYNLNGKQKFLTEMIYHSGYVYDSPEKRRKHFERNSKILLELVEKEPEVLRWQAQMVQEYYSVDEWEKIIEFCEPRVQSTRETEAFMERNNFCTLYAGLLDAYQNLGKNDEFYALCEKINKDERSTDLLKGFIELRKAEVYTSLEDLEKAREFAKRYLERFERLKDDDTTMQTQAGALLLNRTYEKNYLDTAYNVLIYADLKQEKSGALEQLADHMEQDEKGFTLSVKLLLHLVELMISQEDKSQLERIVKIAVKDEDMQRVLCAEAQKREENKEPGFLEIAKIYAKAESDFWYIPYCRLIVADANKNKKAVEEAVEELVKVMPNAFYLTDHAYEIIKKYRIKVALLWSKLLGKNWPAVIHQFVNNCTDEVIQKVEEFVSEVYEQNDWHSVSLQVALMERQVAAGPQMKVLEYYNLLKDYAQKKLAVYGSITAGDELEVPIDVQAAMKIAEYIELEPQDQRLALTRLKEVVDVYPVFARGIGKFFHIYANLEKERIAMQKNEMAVLRNQVTEQVIEMINTGQVTVALQIAGQLKQMFPEDLEVAELALAVRLKSLE